jgi:hypothetical protein
VPIAAGAALLSQRDRSGGGGSDDAGGDQVPVDTPVMPDAAPPMPDTSTSWSLSP